MERNPVNDALITASLAYMVALVVKRANRPELFVLRQVACKQCPLGTTFKLTR